MAINPADYLSAANQTVSDKLFNEALREINGVVQSGGIGSITGGVKSVVGVLSDQLNSTVTATNTIKKYIQSGISGAEGLQQQLTKSVASSESSPIAAVCNENTLQNDQTEDQENESVENAVSNSKRGTEFVTFPSDINEDFSILMSFSSSVKTDFFGKVKPTDKYNVMFPIPSNLTDAVSLKYKQFGYGPMAGISPQDFANAFAGATGEIRGNINDAFNANFSKQRLQAIAYQYFVRPALGVANQNIPSALEASVGVVVNPNESYAFETVNLRQFTFNFRFAPKSQQESIKLRNILREIKKRCLPSVSQNTNSPILGYPDTVELELRPFGKDLFPFKKCFVQSLSYNYAPEGPLFFNDDQKHPAIIDVIMQFAEIEILTRADIDGDIGFGEPTPADPVSSPPSKPTPRPTTAQQKQEQEKSGLPEVKQLDEGETYGGAVTGRTAAKTKQLRDAAAAKSTAASSSNSTTPIATK